MSPCNALAALARLKRARGDGATCWLAINRGGSSRLSSSVPEQLYAIRFVGFIGRRVRSQARLLQRYSLVAFLAPG